MTGETFRVKLIFPASNTKKTLWIRAESDNRARSHARELHSRGIVRSSAPRSPPEDAEVHDLDEEQSP